MNNEMPDEIYVRVVSGKTISAVRPESPLVNASAKRKHTKYIRADKAVPDGWQDIGTAPKDGTHILAWNYESRFNLPPYICWFGQDMNEHDENKREWLTGDGDDWSTGYYYTPCKPTHWMPLPPPPKEGDYP